MKNYFADQPIWFNATPEILARDQRRLFVHEGSGTYSDRRLCIESRAAGSPEHDKVCVAATAIVTPEVAPGIYEGQSFASCRPRRVWPGEG
jgi:hypothetical protein